MINDFRTVLSKLNSLQKLDIVRGALKALETETETCSKANKQEKFDFDETFKRPSSVDHESASSNMESELYKKIEELQEENKTLFASVEELDQQHEESIGTRWNFRRAVTSSDLMPPVFSLNFSENSAR